VNAIKKHWASSKCINKSKKMEGQGDTRQLVLDMDFWGKEFQSNVKKYASALPFPHISFDNFLLLKAADNALKAFPNVQDSGWTHYLHVNERKHGLNKIDLIPPDIRTVIETLNSASFVSHLSALTGIPNLVPDITMEGGGLHQTKRGGYLNVHADFTVHPHRRNWRRRVNLLIYLNKNWEADYLGHIELWERDMSACVQKIAPIFNRVVMFNTDNTSFHGLPEPIQCPENTTRKSIALYYFTIESEAPEKHATNYRARPGDGFKKYLILLDKKLIQLYNSLKGTLGINDDFASKILNKLFKKK
jgi:hypothetical protein